MDLKEFHNLLAPYLQNETVLSMSQYMAHGKVNVLEHSYMVARYSYMLCKKLRLDVDISSLIAGAILHDMYLYDWHKEDPNHKWHGRIHGCTAYQNASKLFVLSDKTRNIIEGHMWPECLPYRPRCTEAIIVSFVDKFSATIEFMMPRAPKFTSIVYSF